MNSSQKSIHIQSRGCGLHLITRDLQEALSSLAHHGRAGVLHVFIRHTSASLLIQENADPSARQDLEEFLDRLVPRHQPWHRHLAEGADDTVSHMKSAITQTFLSIPVDPTGNMLLGTWQGIYLWEHRDQTQSREIVLTLLS